jgi:hypothetical protein
LKNELFFTRGYAEIHIQRPFFDNQNGILKIVILEIYMASKSSNSSTMNPKNYMEELIEKLQSISIASKSFKKPTNILHF